MSPAERAVAALRECAEALDALPPTLRRQPILALVQPHFVNPKTLREEADWIEQVIAAITDATKPK